ncbi:MAG: Rrf2 family transcriptional regulator [Candidatus Methanoperedens sp.]|nr:Rrf2 family transcriptional regulator [Candidatus Methanoperedens sp.]
MKITKKVELGINAVKALKKYHAPVRAQDLATEIGTTFHFLEQIMRDLRTAGIVKSVRGPGGGFILAKDVITAYEVATALGRDLTTFSLDEAAPTSRLFKAIAEAYQNTTI